MINPNEVFDNLAEASIMPAKMESLLKQILELDNPLKFNSLATEEEIEELENTLDEVERLIPKSSIVIREILQTRAAENIKTNFI